MGKSRTVTLLFAHGCGFSKEMWTPVIRRVKESAAAQRVKTEFVTFDFPFHGSRRDVKLAETLTVDLSDRKTPRVRGDCEDLREWYLSAMGEQVASMGECDVLIGVGFSMGAGALWAMEIAHPGTFDALVLFEPTLDTRTPRTTAMCSYLVALTLRRPSSWCV
jgi:pimeloyl-ACP methyl ester carboxylesterase